MKGMRIKQYELRIKVFLNCFFLALFLILAALFYNPTFAQTTPCPTPAAGSPAKVQNGLISTPDLGRVTSLTGECVVDPKAAFAPFKIPTYDDLKSIYYDQSKAPSSQKIALTGDKTEADLNLANADGSLYYIKKTSPSSTDGNLTIGGLIAGSGFGIIFVDGNLTIIPRANQLGDANSGLVFVVKGKINIAPAVAQIYAVLIGDGIDSADASCATSTAGASCYSICTAYKVTSGAIDPTDPCPTALDTSSTQLQLVINGSLISLKSNYPIRFRRDLDAGRNTATPAEKINHQVKYLVILRNLLSDTYQKWTEVP